MWIYSSYFNAWMCFALAMILVMFRLIVTGVFGLLEALSSHMRVLSHSHTHTPALTNLNS